MSISWNAFVKLAESSSTPRAPVTPIKLGSTSILLELLCPTKLNPQQCGALFSKTNSPTSKMSRYWKLCFAVSLTAPSLRMNLFFKHWSRMVWMNLAKPLFPLNFQKNPVVVSLFQPLCISRNTLLLPRLPRIIQPHHFPLLALMLQLLPPRLSAPLQLALLPLLIAGILREKEWDKIEVCETYSLIFSVISVNQDDFRLKYYVARSRSWINWILADPDEARNSLAPIDTPSTALATYIDNCREIAEHSPKSQLHNMLAKRSVPKKQGKPRHNPSR